MPAGNSNGKITAREVYQLILEQNHRIDEMERRLLAKLETVPVLRAELDGAKRDIDSLRQRDYISGLVGVIVAAIGSTIAAVLGMRR